MADTTLQSSLAFNGADSPSVFNFGSHSVRIIVIDGEPWFVASDVAASLGYRDASNAARHLKPHQKGTRNLSTPGGEQKVTIITESGLYKLVLRSRKPEAEEFSDWVTGEVLPSIRKTGQYVKAGHALSLQEMVAALVKHIEAPNSVPAIEFMPLVNAVLRKQGFDLSPASMSPEQATAITDRINSLAKLFHPLSPQFADVLGIRRAMRGLHPKFGTREPGYSQLLAAL